MSLGNCISLALGPLIPIASSTTASMSTARTSTSHLMASLTSRCPRGKRSGLTLLETRSLRLWLRVVLWKMPSWLRCHKTRICWRLLLETGRSGLPTLISPTLNQTDFLVVLLQSTKFVVALGDTPIYDDPPGHKSNKHKA